MRMKRYSAVLLVLVFAAAAAYAEQSRREKLIGYGKLELAPLRNKVGDTLDEKIITDLQAMMVQRTNESKLFSAEMNQSLAFPTYSPQETNL